jgi:hypothetical protein
MKAKAASARHLAAPAAPAAEPPASLADALARHNAAPTQLTTDDLALAASNTTTDSEDCRYKSVTFAQPTVAGAPARSSRGTKQLVVIFDISGSQDCGLDVTAAALRKLAETAVNDAPPLLIVLGPCERRSHHVTRSIGDASVPGCDWVFFLTPTVVKTITDRSFLSQFGTETYVFEKGVAEINKRRDALFGTRSMNLVIIGDGQFSRGGTGENFRRVFAANSDVFARCVSFSIVIGFYANTREAAQLARDMATFVETCPNVPAFLAVSISAVVDLIVSNSGQSSELSEVAADSNATIAAAVASMHDASHSDTWAMMRGAWNTPAPPYGKDMGIAIADMANDMAAGAGYVDAGILSGAYYFLSTGIGSLKVPTFLSNADLSRAFSAFFAQHPGALRSIVDTLHRTIDVSPASLARNPALGMAYRAVNVAEKNGELGDARAAVEAMRRLINRHATDPVVKAFLDSSAADPNVARAQRAAMRNMPTIALTAPGHPGVAFLDRKTLANVTATPAVTAGIIDAIQVCRITNQTGEDAAGLVLPLPDELAKLEPSKCRAYLSGVARIAGPSDVTVVGDSLLHLCTALLTTEFVNPSPALRLLRLLAQRGVTPSWITSRLTGDTLSTNVMLPWWRSMSRKAFEVTEKLLTMHRNDCDGDAEFLVLQNEARDTAEYFAVLDVLQSRPTVTFSAAHTSVRATQGSLPEAHRKPHWINAPEAPEVVGVSSLPIAAAASALHRVATLWNSTDSVAAAMVVRARDVGRAVDESGLVVDAATLARTVLCETVNLVHGLPPTEANAVFPMGKPDDLWACCGDVAKDMAAGALAPCDIESAGVYDTDCYVLPPAYMFEEPSRLVGVVPAWVTRLNHGPGAGASRQPSAAELTSAALQAAANDMDHTDSVPANVKAVWQTAATGRIAAAVEHFGVPVVGNVSCVPTLADYVVPVAEAERVWRLATQQHIAAHTGDVRVVFEEETIPLASLAPEQRALVVHELSTRVSPHMRKVLAAVQTIMDRGAQKYADVVDIIDQAFADGHDLAGTKRPAASPWGAGADVVCDCTPRGTLHVDRRDVDIGSLVESLRASIARRPDWLMPRDWTPAPSRRRADQQPLNIVGFSDEELNVLSARSTGVCIMCLDNAEWCGDRTTAQGVRFTHGVGSHACAGLMHEACMREYGIVDMRACPLCRQPTDDTFRVQA